MACHTNAPTTESAAVSAIGGRLINSRSGPTRSRAQTGSSGRTGAVGRTTPPNSRALGNAITAPSATAHRQPNHTPMLPAASGTSTPATGAPAVWSPIAEPVFGMVRVSSDVATLKCRPATPPSTSVPTRKTA